MKARACRRCTQCDRRDLTLPYSEGPRIEVYRSALRRMVGEARSEPFDALEVAGRYIKGA